MLATWTDTQSWFSGLVVESGTANSAVLGSILTKALEQLTLG